MPREYTYGPFKSRRLGLSLGVNILPPIKICTYNCVYCEIGSTDKLVPPSYRISNPPSMNFRKELMDILKYVPHLDSITFGYNGEPTLNENILDFLNTTVEVRRKIKWKNTPPTITLFTNSSTLTSEEIRNRVKQFELVLAKLDVATEDDFLRTNRPHKESPKVGDEIQSLVKLRKEMKENKLTLQCLIYNSNKKDFISNENENNIIKLANAVRIIEPRSVQIYSIARIPAQYFVYSIDEKRKKQIVKIFKEIINNDLIEINYY